MERILEDLEVFVSMTETINSNLDLERVLQAVTDAGARLSGAQLGAFFYTAGSRNREHFQFYVVSGADRSAFANMPSPRITGFFAPTFAGEGTTRRDDITADPRLHDLLPGHLGLRSYLATPVIARSGEVIGALLFGHRDAAVFDQRSEDVVRLIATQAAVAVENARLFEAEQAARRNAEKAAERVATLQTITARLAQAVTAEEALTAVVDTLVGPMHATRVGVYLLDGELYRAVVSLAEETPVGTVVPTGVETPQTRTLPARPGNPVSDAVARRGPLLLTDPGELVERYPEVMATVTGVDTAVVLPLVCAEDALGALVLAWREPRPLADEEVEMLAAAADQLSAALQRAQLQEALRDSAEYAISVSQTLQRSLLPSALPCVDSVEVAVRYVPGSADAEVGGDWYDVITTPDGGAVLVVGDVQGHSVSAAGVMGQLRTALHAYLAEGHPPHVAVARVNRVMETLNAHVLATCCLISLDAASGLARIVRAGHPLPLLAKADGSVREIGAEGGIPLGVFPEAEWPTTTVQLGAGDRILLYTDGLVETPSAGVTAGVTKMVEAVVGAGRGALESDVDEVLARLKGPRRDDVALLVCEYAGPANRDERVTLEVGTVADVAVARGLTRETLKSWNLRELEDAMTLLVSEMVTNALVHTDGAATLELRRQPDRVRVMVTDGFSRVPRSREAGLEDTGGRGLLLVEALSAEWGVEPSGKGKTVWADVVA